MKKVLFVFVVLLLTGCADNNIVNVYTDGAKFEKEYEALNENGIVVDIDTNSNIKYLELTEVIDLFENKTGVIYFGFPNCPWCRNMIPILLDVTKENHEVLYYFNPSGVRGTNDENFSKLMTILDNYLTSNSEGVKTLYVPDVYFIKDGSIVGHHLGSAPTQTNPYELLTEEQKIELKNIYRNLIKEMKEN